MKIDHILVVYTKPKNKLQKDTIKHVKEVLKKNKISFIIHERFFLRPRYFKNMDMILVIGGDGTFLRTSHFVMDKTPLMGVNLDPANKEGFFMVSDKKDFEKKLKKVIAGKHKIKQLHRVQAYIGNKKVAEPALNEYYIASEVPYHTARYHLTLRGKRERQKSSGVLVGTAAGSYAWIKSAGGKTLPLFSDNFTYVIREPYCGRTAAKCSLHSGILKKNEKISIEFEIGNGIIIADSTANEYEFKAGQKVTISLSDKPIHAIRF